MKKTKFDYCCFTDGAVEEIQSWHKFGEDIVFFVKGQAYLFKYREFIDDIMEAEFRGILGRSRGIFRVHHCFYKHCGRESVWPVEFYGKIRNDRDEWFVADIEKICLYMGEVEK